jgi:hypothetical protein
LKGKKINANIRPNQLRLVRDSSAVRQLFVWLAGAVGRQSTLHKENSGFAAHTLGWHISTFRGYQILFSIRNPYINRFSSPIIFLFIHNHLTLRKWCYTRVQHDFHINPIISPCQFLFQPFVTWLRENYDYRNVSWEMICIYDLTLSKMRGRERNTCSFRSLCVTLQGSRCRSPMSQFAIFFLDWWLKSAAGDFFGA